MVVHFPIVLIIIVALIEFFRFGLHGSDTERIKTILINFSFLTALVSVIFGYQLMSNEGYSGRLIDLHYYTGVATLILTAILGLLRFLESGPRIFRFFLALSVVLVTIAGHFGATLTHGEDYLTEVFQKDTRPDSEKVSQLLSEVENAADTDSLLLERLSTEVKGIIAHNCYQCHNENKVKGGLILDSKEGVFAGGESGPVIVPGVSEESELFRRISLDKNHDEVMPKKGKKLKDAEIQLIKKWINLGAYYNDKVVNVFPEAALSLTKPPVPSNSEFSNPIDKIVASYFEEKDIDFGEAVSDRLYIRRAYMDIIGLLPSPHQIQSFVDDDRPTKRETLVDSLLADRYDFSAHWLSFWNDLLRNDYSGPGYITGGRKEITNWLYNSVSDNKSYDSIVAQLLNPTSESDGFINGIKWRGSVNSSQTTEMQAAQNIGQSLLGVNVKCASCHNSFVSNLKLDQVYAFANIFSDSTLEINRCDKPTGKMAGTGFIYPELGEVKGETVSERLESLAGVVVNPDNGRLYRTFVNRIWGKLMGRGIIYRYDEMDDEPWSEDLLDFLAADFRDNGSDINRLVKQIVTSSVYQLPTVHYETVEDIASAKYVFAGPIPRRLTSEQFTDAISQVVNPLYSSLTFNPFGIQNNANWIWKREIEFDRAVLPKPGKVYFRKKIDLSSASTGKFRITADDSFELYFNGEKVAENDNWEEVIGGEISLKEGQNVIAIAAENRGSIPKPAGVLFTMAFPVTDGSIAYISSDEDWLCSNENSGDWQSEDYDDSDWEPAGDQNRKHWGLLPGFDLEGKWNKPFVRGSFVALDPLMKALGRPSREIVTTNRVSDPSLLQALNLTNNDFLYKNLMLGSDRFEDLSDEELIEFLYISLLGRAPAEEESETILGYENEDRKAFIADVVWSIVLLPEFQFIQ